MSTTGQFNTKNPTIKRILREATELASNPSPDLHAEPLESNLFEWHFTLRGPPSPSPFANGLYHGRIVLPLTYPLRPPSFRFLTPSGRFEVNREICLSISGHHEETWQPAWGIRTALTAIRSFMDTDVKGQVGGLSANEDARKRFATASVNWTCASCKKSNRAIMAEREEACKGAGEGKAKEEVVPEELRLAYREELDGVKEVGDVAETGQKKFGNPSADSTEPGIRIVSSESTGPGQSLNTHVAPQGQVQVQQAPRQSEDAWMDKAIYAIAALLALLIARKILTFL